jgi:hypothetical protein
MNIVEPKHTWNGTLAKRNSTKFIILHHRAGNGTVESIHAQHLTQGWSGIGYHFYVRKDGTVYRGRPIDTIGAHCQGHNNYSVGVCFEGNFGNEKMPSAQIGAGRALIAYLKGLYPGTKVERHSFFMTTACPGDNFPFDEVVNYVQSDEQTASNNGRMLLESANDIIWELMNGELKVPIDEVDRAVMALERAKNENSSLYWILYKVVNKEEH